MILKSGLLWLVLQVAFLGRERDLVPCSPELGRGETLLSVDVSSGDIATFTSKFLLLTLACENPEHALRCLMFEEQGPSRSILVKRTQLP